MCMTLVCFFFVIECQVWNLLENKLTPVNALKWFKQLSYYVEEIRASDSMTAVVVSLCQPGIIEAIDYLKTLAKRWKKKVYTISILKPNIAKLTNFPEVSITDECRQLIVRNLLKPTRGSFHDKYRYSYFVVKWSYKYSR